jgi:hypothetical protein
LASFSKAVKFWILENFRVILEAVVRLNFKLLILGEDMNKNSRRKVLKALAVGAPAVWAKPAVNSVVLPAHAETSGLCQTVAGDGYYHIVDIEICEIVRTELGDPGLPICNCAT